MLERIPPNCELHVHIERLGYVDHACLDLLMNWEQQHEATGGRLVIDWSNLTARFQTRGATVSQERREDTPRALATRHGQP